GCTRSCAEEVHGRKRQKLEQVTEYQELRYVLGTSTSVERLFSITNSVMTDKRRSMRPMMFENIMFLKPNRAFWNSTMVAKAIQMSIADDTSI
ncbi:hypothetical protein JG687_00016730, partial [Phytophthora cactorum]